MADPQQLEDLTEVMRAAGRAHHAAIGAPNPKWAAWYANQMLDSIGPALGFTPNLEDLTSWLYECEREHNASAPDERWPAWYATYMLDVIVPRLS